MAHNILIIDDDVELCSLLKQCLNGEGYQTSVIHSGKNIEDVMQEKTFRLIILDIMLPDLDGFEVLKRIRSYSKVPVLMLSAKNQEMDKVLGLKIGADDYLTKPFGLAELIARVNSLVRRYTLFGSEEIKNAVIFFGELKLDKDKCVVIKRNQTIDLTAKEYKLLCFLAEHPGQVFTKKQIYQNVWEEEYVYDDNTIMALIRRVRKKIEDNPETPQYIQTVWGIGYRFGQ